MNKAPSYFLLQFDSGKRASAQRKSSRREETGVHVGRTNKNYFKRLLMYCTLPCNEIDFKNYGYRWLFTHTV